MRFFFRTWKDIRAVCSQLKAMHCPFCGASGTLIRYGFVYGIGKGYLHLNNGSTQKALRAAHVIALQSILKVAAGVRISDRGTIEALGKSPIVIELKALVHFTEFRNRFVESTSRPYFEITLRSPLNGIEGLTSKLLNRLKGESRHWREFPKPATPLAQENNELPWLVIDARRLQQRGGARPALFPKIISPAGEIVYSLPQVNETAVIKRGMAKYVIAPSSLERTNSRAETLECIITTVKALLSTKEAFAEEKSLRKIQKKLLIHKAIDGQGLGQTNLVIAETDVQQLKAEDAASQILRNCRVIVIVSSSGFRTGSPRPVILSGNAFQVISAFSSNPSLHRNTLENRHF